MRRKASTSNRLAKRDRLQFSLAACLAGSVTASALLGVNITARTIYTDIPGFISRQKALEWDRLPVTWERGWPWGCWTKERRWYYSNPLRPAHGLIPIEESIYTGSEIEEPLCNDEGVKAFGLGGPGFQTVRPTNKIHPLFEFNVSFLECERPRFSNIHLALNLLTGLLITIGAIVTVERGFWALAWDIHRREITREHPQRSP